MTARHATGATVLAGALRSAGVTTLFNLSGNQTMPLYSPLVDAGVELVHTRHEAAAVHMADAYARLTERPCPVLLTAGPGHANALSALYVAQMAESPVVMLSGHSELTNAGLGAFQEMDQVGLARRVAKASWLARDPARLGDDLARAYRIANSGTPGPVHVSVPADVLRGPAPGVAAPRTTAFRAPLRRPAQASVAALLARIGTAKRPLLLAGPAMARGARWRAVTALAERLSVPALPMESPRGANDPALGGVRTVFSQADLVVLIGRKRDFSLGFGRAPLFAPHVEFVDAGADALGMMRRGMSEACSPGDSGWRLEVEASTQLGRADWGELERSDEAPMHPLRLMAATRPLFREGDVFVGDGGEFGQWAQAGAPTGVDRVINGPSGAIGGSIPFAIGAHFARPSARVIAFLGDGTVGFHLAEMDTAARHRAGFVAVVGNDGVWNAEVQIQRGLGGAPLACLHLGRRYDEAARAFGAYAERVDLTTDLAPSLERALASRGPALVDVAIRAEPAPSYHP